MTAVTAALLLVGSIPGQFSVERISVKTDGSELGIYSEAPAISADGQTVAFMSLGGFVAEDTNGHYDVFVRNRPAATTERVSVRSDGAEGAGYTSDGSPMSGDGTCVGFSHCFSLLIPPYGMGCPYGYVRDRAGASTEIVTIDDSGSTHFGFVDGMSLSHDGRYVAFGDELAFVTDDTNFVDDVFVRDRIAGTTERVSLDSAGNQVSGASLYPSISANGRYVTFESDASDLVTGDTNGVRDVFLHDRETGETTRVSVSSTGTQGNGPSLYAAISADGRYVAFQSEASNLVAGDTNNVSDVFVHNRETGATERVSVSTYGVQGDEESTSPSIDADGQYVAFGSEADNLVYGDSGFSDVFVRNRLTDETVRVSCAADGSPAMGNSGEPKIAADAPHVVAFWSYAANLVADDTNHAADIFVVGIGPLAVRWPRYEARDGAGGPFAALAWWLVRWLCPAYALL